MAFRTIPLPRTFTDGEVVTAQMLTTLSSVAQLLQSPPMAASSRVAALSIPNGNWTTIPMDTALLDYDGMTNYPGTINPGLNINTPGLWTFMAKVGWGSSGVGDRLGHIMLNGNTGAAPWEGNNTPASDSFTWERSFRCVAGDVVKLEVYQDSGAPLASNPSGAPFPNTVLMGRWISR